MNARERFLETLKFGRPDRPFLLPQWFFEETIERWQSEGLPADVDIGEFFGFHRYELIPVCVGLYPFEVAAGSDAVATRKKYGEKLAIIGNIDKRALAKGKKDIEEEVMSKVPPLLASGGYMPFVDHAVPPDVPFDNFCYYMELIKNFR